MSDFIRLSTIFDFTQTISLYKAVNSLSQWEEGEGELLHYYDCTWVMLTFQSTPLYVCLLSCLMTVLFYHKEIATLDFMATL